MSTPRQLPSGKWQIRWIDAFGKRCSESYFTQEQAEFALRRHDLERDLVKVGARLPGTSSLPSNPPHPTKACCYVYFIHREGHGLVKIGIAGNVDRRREALQTGSAEPLRTVASYALSSREDASRMEAQLHGHFAHLRMLGEWFSLSADLVAFMRRGHWVDGDVWEACRDLVPVEDRDLAEREERERSSKAAALEAARILQGKWY